MGCDMNGSGCKICPGMWIAALLFLVMMIQSVFFRAPTSATIPAAESASQASEAKSPYHLPQ